MLRADVQIYDDLMDHLNAGYIQLGLVALAFGGLQIWWISRIPGRRNGEGRVLSLNV